MYWFKQDKVQGHSPKKIRSSASPCTQTEMCVTCHYNNYCNSALHVIYFMLHGTIFI